MAKKHDTRTREFIQADYDEVRSYLCETLREAFLVGAIDLKWCATYVPQYILDQAKKRESEAAQQPLVVDLQNTVHQKSDKMERRN